MDNLPKELTPELLGLVSGDKESVKICRELSINNNELHFTSLKVNGFYDLVINIDTLTRLMKEWCWKQDYRIEIHFGNDNDYEWFVFHQGRGEEQVTFMDNIKDFTPTEFEAVLKATSWVQRRMNE